MEKETRMSKYKDLRVEIKDEAGISNPTVTDEISNEEDDFLSFVKDRNREVTDDTLLQPLTSESASSTDVNDILNSRNSTHDTRMDIYHKIRPVESNIKSTKSTSDEKKETPFLDQLAALSPDEDIKDLEDYKKEIQEPVKKEVKPKKEKEVKPKVKEKKEKRSKPVKEKKKTNKLELLLNVVTIVLVVIFIVLFGLILKQMFLG